MAESSQGKDEMTERAWKLLVKANPHKEKLEEARRINPEAVEKLLRSYHQAEQVESKKMVKLLHGLSDELGTLKKGIAQRHELDSYLHDMLELELDGDEECFEILDEYKRNHLLMDGWDSPPRGGSPTERGHSATYRGHSATQRGHFTTQRGHSARSNGKEKGRLKLQIFGQSPSPCPFTPTPSPKRQYRKTPDPGV